MDRRVHHYNLENSHECSSDIDCGEEGECHYSYCICKQGFEYDHIKKLCVICPGEGDPCDTCCNPSGLRCIKNECICPTDDGYFSICSSSQTGVFVTASQIALSAALIMGIAALAMVIYRLCTKPRYLSTRHQTAAERLSEGCSRGNTSYLRASLSSIQIRVLSRLRDRPPAYEAQTRTISQQVEIQPRNLLDPEAPPPYEGQELRRSHHPPPYTEIIASPAGYLNPTFVNNETSVTNDKLEKDDETKVLKEESSKPE